jgi:hypothetical protein
MNIFNKSYNNISRLNEKLSFRVSIANMFQATQEIFEEDYGGELLAYSFESISVDEWFERFRQQLLEAIGNKYLPVYRMADGEYQFLFGIKFNFHSHRFFRYILSFILHKIIETIAGPRIKTSWGENYRGEEIIELRRKYTTDLKNLLENGILCAYLNENPKNAFVHYNRYFLKYIENNDLDLNKNNLFPFHFPFFALSNDGWKEFIVNRKILIVTGNLENKKQILEKNLTELGSRKVGFYEISSSSSLKDVVNKDKIENREEFEIAFIGAGIGSLNIISQMKWFAGPVIDVGGFISALQNKDFFCHGGAVKYPGIR